MGSKRPILQFVSIKRKDCGEWAIPGVCPLFKKKWQINFWSNVLFHSTVVTDQCWCLWQGMVDPGEKVSLTLQREFSEEAMNSLAVSPSERAKIHERITNLFKSAGFTVSRRHRFKITSQLWCNSEKRNIFFANRFSKDMWMIPGTPTTPGWRRSPSISTMSQVSISFSFFFYFYFENVVRSSFFHKSLWITKRVFCPALTRPLLSP